MQLNQMRYALAPEAASVSVDMSVVELVPRVLQLCKDTKQQETRLRGITLVLLISCASIYCYTVLRDYGSSRNLTEPGVAYSQKQTSCPTVKAPSATTGMHIDLIGRNSSWVKKLGSSIEYNERTQAIVIPENGVYFIYVQMTFTCQVLAQKVQFQTLEVDLYQALEGYAEKQKLMKALDSVACQTNVFRTLSVGRLYELNKNDEITVQVKNAQLILRSTFGAYRI